MLSNRNTKSSVTTLPDGRAHTAAAQTRKTGIECTHADLQPGQRIGNAQIASVMQMQAVPRRTIVSRVAVTTSLISAG